MYLLKKTVLSDETETPGQCQLQTILNFTSTEVATMAKIGSLFLAYEHDILHDN